MKRRIAKDQERADNARLLRAWKTFHREEREAVLVSPYARTLAELFRMFVNLQHAQLVDRSKSVRTTRHPKQQ